MSAKPHPVSPSFGRHFTLRGALTPGTAVGDGATVREIIPIHGLLRGRARCKLSAGDGTFRFKYVKPVAGAAADAEFPDDGSSLVATGNPDDLAAPDTTEVMRDIDDLYGEAFLEISYTDTAGGSTIGQVTFSGV